MRTTARSRGFWGFYREYTESAVHTASLVALTALGLLSTVDRWFIPLAVAAYVVPALSLYLGTRGPAERERTGEEVRPSGATREHDDERPPAEPTEEGAPSPRRESPPRERRTGRTDEADGDGEQEPRDRGVSTPTEDETPTETDEPTETETRTETEEPIETKEPTETDDGGTGEENGENEREWRAVETTAEVSLTDVTGADGCAFAVGEAGTLLARTDGGWETVLEEGPTGRSTDLSSVSVSEDGERVWMAGDGGVLASYDPESGRVTDRSAPLDITSSWTDCAAVGAAGEETITLLTGSGEVVRGTVSGTEIKWDEPVKPGSGSSATGAAFAEGVGYVCDSNASVFEIREHEFERIGVEDGGSFTDIAASAPSEVSAVASDGSVHRYDGTTWTRSAASEGALTGIDLAGDRGLVCSDAGELLDRESPGWEAAEVPTDEGLNAVVLDVGGVDLAVGDSGTVLERGINSA
ncbi:hypothetical protein [Natronorarus salvus]|uniref:hypothetical protein n=1 Tax=Natronorarus salvus TaxID=3117733 RepID=UPI002F263281